MHHKTKSIIVLATLFLLMVSLAILMNKTQNTITGAVVKQPCECKADSDCDDNNPETTDVCLYPDSCIDSICINKR